MSSLIDTLDNNSTRVGGGALSGGDDDNNERINRLFPKCKPRSSTSPRREAEEDDGGDIDCGGVNINNLINLDKSGIITVADEDNNGGFYDGNSMYQETSESCNSGGGGVLRDGRKLNASGSRNRCSGVPGLINNVKENRHHHHNHSSSSNSSSSNYTRSSLASISKARGVKKGTSAAASRNSRVGPTYESLPTEEDKAVTEEEDDDEDFFFALKESKGRRNKNCKYASLIQAKMENDDENFDGGIGSGGSSGSNASSGFSQSSSSFGVNSGGEHGGAKMERSSSSGIGSTGTLAGGGGGSSGGSGSGLRDSRIEIAGGREVYSQNRIRAGRRVRGSTSMESMHQQGPPGTSESIKSSTSQSQLHKQAGGGAKAKRRTVTSTYGMTPNPLISPTSPSSGVWEEEAAPPARVTGAAAVRNNIGVYAAGAPPADISRRYNSGGNYGPSEVYGGQQHQQQQRPSKHGDNSRTTAVTSSDYNAYYYGSEYDFRSGGSPTAGTATMDDRNEVLKSEARGYGNLVGLSPTGSSMTIKETVFDSQVTSIEKPVGAEGGNASRKSVGGGVGRRSSEGRGSFVYETRIDGGGEIVFDDIERDEWTGEVKKRVPASSRSKQEQLVEQLNFLDSLVAEDFSASDERLLGQREKEVDECASNWARASTTGDYIKERPEQKRLIGSIPIAEYEGSPKRYGLRQPSQSRPSHLELVDPTTQVITQHLKCASSPQQTQYPKAPQQPQNRQRLQQPSNTSGLTRSRHQSPSYNRVPGFPLRIDTTSGSTTSLASATNLSHPLSPRGAPMTFESPATAARSAEERRSSVDSRSSSDPVFLPDSIADAKAVIESVIDNTFGGGGGGDHSPDDSVRSQFGSTSRSQLGSISRSFDDQPQQDDEHQIMGAEAGPVSSCSNIIDNILMAANEQQQQMHHDDNDLMYEFSETRKVLEEFFRPADGDYRSAGGSEAANGACERNFDELDYRLKRQAGNSYVGQRLAAVESIGGGSAANNERPPDSPKKPHRRGILLGNEGIAGASPRLISFQEDSSTLTTTYSVRPGAGGADSESLFMKSYPDGQQEEELEQQQQQQQGKANTPVGSGGSNSVGGSQGPEASRDVNDNDIDADSASSRTETDPGDTEVGLQVGHSRNFTLSPETTDCDSNELESEISLDYEASLHSSSRFGGQEGGGIMPVLEDGLSSGNLSDNYEDEEDEDEDVYNQQRLDQLVHRGQMHDSGESRSSRGRVGARSKKSGGGSAYVKNNMASAGHLHHFHHNHHHHHQSGAGGDPNPTLMLMKKQITEIEKEIKLRSGRGHHYQQHQHQQQQQHGVLGDPTSTSVTATSTTSPFGLNNNSCFGGKVDSSAEVGGNLGDIYGKSEGLRDLRAEANVFDCNDPELEALDPMRPTPPPSPAPPPMAQQTRSVQSSSGKASLPNSSSTGGRGANNFNGRPTDFGMPEVPRGPQPAVSSSSSSTNPNGGAAAGNSGIGDLLHEPCIGGPGGGGPEGPLSPGGSSKVDDGLIKDGSGLKNGLGATRAYNTDTSTHSMFTTSPAFTNNNKNASTNSTSMSNQQGSPDDVTLSSSSPVWVPRHASSKIAGAPTSATTSTTTSTNAYRSNGPRGDPFMKKQRYDDTLDDEADTDQETDRLLGQNRTDDDYGFYDEKEKEGNKKKRNKEDFLANPSVLIEGVLFRARYLGSTQLVCEGQPTKATRMLQAEEAVSRIKTVDVVVEEQQQDSNQETWAAPPPMVKTSDSRKLLDEPKSQLDDACSKTDFELANPSLGFKPITEYRRKDLEDEDTCNSNEDDSTDSSDSSEDEMYSRKRSRKELSIKPNSSSSCCSSAGRDQKAAVLNSFGGSLPQLSPSSAPGATACSSSSSAAAAAFGGLPGTMFRLGFLGSMEVEEEVGLGRRRRKRPKKDMVEEAVMKLKTLAPEGETQPSTEVDLFISTEKIMVLNTDLKEIMMDHALRTISYIADIGDLVVLMARRRPVPSDAVEESKVGRPPKMICHVFESDEAQYIAQSIGQAFQVAYMEFLKANGIEDHSFVREMDYQEVLNSQEIFGDELQMFAKKELQKDVVCPKAKGEILGVVIVESGWGSMLPTVVIANLSPGGAAARCGHLNIGDQIIAINGVSLVGLPLSTCQTYIKNTKNQTVVKLTVVPCPPVVEVKIKRPDTKYQLGFSVQNGVICSLLRGGIAERGGVRVGHRIIEINNQSVVAVPHEKIVNLLATSVGEINMKTMPTSMFRLLTGQESPMYI